MVIITTVAYSNNNVIYATLKFFIYHFLVNVTLAFQPLDWL
jgi:hypothetical protein